MNQYLTVTSLGCRIALHQAPPHLGHGLILRLSIDDVHDTRTAEVYFDMDEAQALGQALIALSEPAS